MRYINIEARIYVPDCENQCNYTLKKVLLFDENRDIEEQSRDYINTFIGQNRSIIRLDLCLV